MIIGIGNDVVNMRRLARLLARYPQRLPARVLTADEARALHQLPRRRQLAFLAGRWAAKEAFGKALGCGMVAPIRWRQVGVLNDAGGKPRFALAAAAAAFTRARGAAHCHLSISHDGDYASAVVLLEGEA